MSGGNVSITYEILYELLRREKNREALQELSPTLYPDVEQYILEKARYQNKLIKEGNLASGSTISQQILNTEKLFNELLGRREKKILLLAYYQSHTKSHKITTTAMLPSEEELYRNVVSVLSAFRKTIVEERKKAKGSDSPSLEKKNNHSEMSNLNNEASSDSKHNGSIKKTQQVEQTEQTGNTEYEDKNEEPNSGAERIDAVPLSSSEVNPKQKNTVSPEEVTLECVADIPAFVGPDFQELGPFKKGEAINLPKQIADLLIRREQAKMSQ